MRPFPQAYLSRRQALALGLLLPGSSVLIGKAQAEAKTVRSFEEIRRKGVVIQEWDLSCGAAALATILAFQHGDAVSEREIAKAMLAATDQELVRRRLGFSLLDLKRFLATRGYVGEGYAEVELDDLGRLAPAIVPLRLQQTFDHFVVFRGLNSWAGGVGGFGLWGADHTAGPVLAGMAWADCLRRPATARPSRTQSPVAA